MNSRKGLTTMILISVVAAASGIAGGACRQNQNVQGRDKANARQTAANKANDTNGLMQADTDSTQTLSTTNSNTNINANLNR